MVAGRGVLAGVRALVRWRVGQYVYVIAFNAFFLSETGALSLSPLSALEHTRTPATPSRRHWLHDELARQRICVAERRWHTRCWQEEEPQARQEGRVSNCALTVVAIRSAPTTHNDPGRE